MVCSRSARRLSRESHPWPRGLGATLRAALAYKRGHHEVASGFYLDAARLFESSGFASHHHAVMLQRAALTHDDDVVHERLTALTNSGVVAPEHYVTTIAPGPITGD